MKTGRAVQQSPSPGYIPGPELSPRGMEISSILTPAALARLRRAYNQAPEQMTDIVINTIKGMYNQSSDLLQEMRTEFFTPQSVTPQTFTARDREQIVIALLAARMGNRRMYLALHFYWGLMVDLSPEEIAHRLLFVGFYSGIDTLTSSLETLRVVLAKLEQHTATARADDALAPQSIMVMLKTLFP